MTAFAQGIIASKLIDQMSHEMKKNIKYAYKKGLLLEIEAGNQINLAIERTKNAYESSLNLTIDKVDALFAKHLIELNNAVKLFHDAVTTGVEGLDKMVEKAQAAALTLPYAGKQSQLISFTPTKIVLTEKESIINFVFKGSFSFADQEGFTPTFTIMDQTYKPTQNLLLDLTFQVSSKVFAAVDPINNPCITGTLKAPWAQMGDPTPINSTYNLLFEVLPISPGRITVETLTPRMKRIIESRSQPFNFRVDKHFMMIVKNSNGWNIEPNSETVHFISGRVEKNEFMYSRNDAIYYKVKAPGRPVSARVDYREFRDEIEQVAKKEDYVLGWGEHRILEIPADAKWKVLFDSHVGTQYQADMAAMNTPFVQSYLEGTKLHIVVAQPGEPRRLTAKL